MSTVETMPGLLQPAQIMPVATIAQRRIIQLSGTIPASTAQAASTPELAPKSIIRRMLLYADISTEDAAGVEFNFVHRRADSLEVAEIVAGAQIIPNMFISGSDSFLSPDPASGPLWHRMDIELPNTPGRIHFAGNNTLAVAVDFMLRFIIDNP